VTWAEELEPWRPWAFLPDVELALHVVTTKPDWEWSSEAETLCWGSGGQLILDSIAHELLGWATALRRRQEATP
jgi:hypothetical protein